MPIFHKDIYDNATQPFELRQEILLDHLRKLASSTTKRVTDTFPRAELSQNDKEILLELSDASENLARGVANCTTHDAIDRAYIRCERLTQVVARTFSRLWKKECDISRIGGKL